MRRFLSLVFISWSFVVLINVNYANSQGAPQPPGNDPNAPRPPADGGGGAGGGADGAADPSGGGGGAAAGGGGGGYQKRPSQRQYQRPRQQQYGRPQQYGGGGGGGGGFVPPPPYPLPPPAPMSCDIDPKCWLYAVECSAADAYPFERHSCGSCEECLQLCLKYARPGGPPQQLGCGGCGGGGGGCGGGCPQQQGYGGGGGGYGGGGGGGGYGGGQQGGYGGGQQGGYGGGQQGGGGGGYGGGQQGGYAGRIKRDGGVGGACGGGPCPYYCQAAVFDAQYKTCDLFAVNAPKLKKYPGRAYFQSTGLCSLNQTNATQAPVANCPSGQTAKVIEVKGYQLSGFSGKDAPGVTSDDACAKACLNNQLPDGTPITCKSAQFSGGKCQLSDQDPKTTTDVKPGDGTYLKKFCFPSDLVKNCPDVWEEDPQKVLVGQNKITVDQPTYDQCLLACLNSQQQYGFVCKSGHYFYQEGKLNCILNTETKGTKPDLFTDAGEGDIVVYFEPDCGGTKKAKHKRVKTLAEALRDIPLNAWSLWSECKGTWLTQVRFRQCGELDPRKCDREERSCDPSARTTSVQPSQSTREELMNFRRNTTTGTSKRPIITSEVSVVSERALNQDTRAMTRHVSSSMFPPKIISTSTTTTTTTSTTTESPDTTPEYLEEIIAAGRLIDKNEVRRADAVSEDGVCRAITRNGVKNCRIGVRLVGGLKRYCSTPIDC